MTQPGESQATVFSMGESMILLSKFLFAREVIRGVGALAARVRRYRAAREFAEASDYLLADVGVSRFEIDYAIRGELPNSCAVFGLGWSRLEGRHDLAVVRRRK